MIIKQNLQLCEYYLFLYQHQDASILLTLSIKGKKQESEVKKLSEWQNGQYNIDNGKINNQN